jgi:hypothetical protein
MHQDHPKLPVERLHEAAQGNAEASARIDALHRELQSEQPASAAIKEHVEELRKHPSLRSLIVGWFDDPRTQLFINDLILEGF